MCVSRYFWYRLFSIVRKCLYCIISCYIFSRVGHVNLLRSPGSVLSDCRVRVVYDPVKQPRLEPANSAGNLAHWHRRDSCQPTYQHTRRTITMRIVMNLKFFVSKGGGRHMPGIQKSSDRIKPEDQFSLTTEWNRG